MRYGSTTLKSAVTAQRRTVLRTRRKVKGHPLVEDVYLVVKEDNPRVALGTVYQAFSVLEEIGPIEAKHWTESLFCGVEG